MTDNDLIRRVDALAAIMDDPVATVQHITALPVQPVRVKPLEWRQSGGAHMMDGESHTVPTGYTVRYADENGWKWTAMGCGAFGYSYSPCAAMAAAQADYEARILAAIEPAPAPTLAEALKLPKIAALVEALTDLEKAASEVAKYGAQTGDQWVKLTVALLKARPTLRSRAG